MVTGSCRLEGGKARLPRVDDTFAGRPTTNSAHVPKMKQGIYDETGRVSKVPVCCVESYTVSQ